VFAKEEKMKAGKACPSGRWDKMKRAVLHPEHGTFATRTITTLEDPAHTGKKLL
jgi:hypothetical protein